MEINNNLVTVVGTISDPPVYSHSHLGEKFYSFKLEVRRLSEAVDEINVTVSEKLINVVKLETGAEIEVSGQFRSYNNYSGTGSRLVLSIFVKDIKYADEFSDTENPNKIYLNGFLCKKPVYRTTPFGREIADIILAVNRLYGKSDYIPCIAWGRNAKYAGTLEVGENIEIWGRIQSRQYTKKTEDGNEISKTAFEVSVSKLQLVEKSDAI